MEYPLWWTNRIVSVSVLLHFAVLTIYCDMDFTIYDIEKDREDARQYCVDNNHAGLAVLDTQQKMDAVLALSTYQNIEEYWVGLQQGDTSNPQKTTFVWDSGNAGSWAAWNSIEPNNLQTEFCARIRGNYRELANMECSRQYFFVCEDSYDDPTTATAPTTEAPTTNPSVLNFERRYGNYPIIHGDRTLQNQYPSLERFSGTASSELGCVVICARDSQCGYVVFSRINRMCTTYSSSLKHESYSLLAHLGTNIREKRI